MYLFVGIKSCKINTKNLFLNTVLRLQVHVKVYIITLSLMKDVSNLEKEKKQMRGLTNYVLIPLTIIGALNWGLIGIFGFDLVAFIFGPASIASSIVYSIIGIAALAWLIWMIVDRTSHHDDR